jgi:hypothetical protein
MPKVTFAQVDFDCLISVAIIKPKEVLTLEGRIARGQN